MLRLFASFLGALTVSLYANANSQEIVIIENVNVIPMTSEVVLKNQSVVVKNGKVESICPAAAKECNVEGARVIAADGKYLIPGLSDMHAHINPGDIGENELLSEKDIVMDDIPYIQLDRDKSDEPSQIPIHRDLDYNIISLMPMQSTRQSSSKKLKRELAKYNIMGSLKNLRASFVSHLHDQGLSTQDIKVAVGHTSSRMTGHYTTPQLKSVSLHINRL